MDGISSEMPAAPDNIAVSLRKSRRVRILFVFLTVLLEPCEDSVYEIVEPLGSGSMGEVSHAFETDLRRNAAVKVLPLGNFDQPRLNLCSSSLARRAKRQRPQPPTMESNQAYLERDLVAWARATATVIAITTQYLHPHPRGRSRGGRRADQRRSDPTRKSLKTCREFHKQIPNSGRNFVTKKPDVSWPRSIWSPSLF
jgi:serine/threonine protein kinase